VAGSGQHDPDPHQLVSAVSPVFGGAGNYRGSRDSFLKGYSNGASLPKQASVKNQTAINAPNPKSP
jgi:hypothetical protein